MFDVDKKDIIIIKLGNIIGENFEVIGEFKCNL